MIVFNAPKEETRASGQLVLTEVAQLVNLVLLKLFDSKLLAAFLGSLALIVTFDVGHIDFELIDLIKDALNVVAKINDVPLGHGNWLL